MNRPKQGIRWEETEKPKPIAFLSHSHEDATFGRRIVDDLAIARLRIWLDIIDMPEYLRHFRLHEDVAHLHQELSWGIYRAETVLVLLSPEAIRSRWIELELRIAEFNEARIIPLLLRPCSVPLETSSSTTSSPKAIQVPLSGAARFSWPLVEVGHGWSRVARTIMMSRLVKPNGEVHSLHYEPGFENGYIDFSNPENYASAALALADLLV